MPNLKNSDRMLQASYRPEQQVCPICKNKLKRDHIAWRKRIIFSSGEQTVTSWVYRCPEIACPNRTKDYRSENAEKLHLKQHRFSRELIVRIGYQRFWQHRTMYEIHDWLTNDLRLSISEREVAYIFVDFLALLCAAQPANIQNKLSSLQKLIISIDGMQPEKGNDCLYIVREVQCGVTLLAARLEESTQEALCEHIFEPIKSLMQKHGLPCHGVVSDAQETIRLARAQSLRDVPHQACQSHCLRDAGELTFEADRATKKTFKASLRQALSRLRKRIRSLAEDNLLRPILLDYTVAIRSVLLEGGVAPFELGGVKVYDALEDLEASLLRCQKKGITSCCAGYWF